MIDLLIYNSAKDIEFLKVQCDKCFNIFERTKKNVKMCRKRMGMDLCQSCSAFNSLHKKPQCQSEYWDDIKKETHGNIIKNSQTYIDAIKTRPSIEGDSNPMYGKRHKKSTIEKMSQSRTGKTGENSTAWKGGKESLIKKLKRYNYFWFEAVKCRDNYTCKKCNNKENILDSHHIKPFSIIVKELKMEYDIFDDNVLFDLLKDHPLIVDKELNNGITLCRKCHREAHSNWGSKINPI